MTTSTAPDARVAETMRKYLFNLGEKERGVVRNLVEGVRTRVFFGDKVMLSLVELDPNKSGKEHHHPEEQWGLCLEGEGVRIQDGVEFPVRTGDFWYTPGNMPHTMIAGPAGVKVMDIFGPPREEYKVPGDGYGPGEKR